MAIRPFGEIVPMSSTKPSQRHLPMLPAELRPIDERELGVKLAQTLAIWPPPDNLAAIMPHYRMALADVPADLVDVALRHVALHSKWFPKPAELREPIERLLDQRRRRVTAQSERIAHIAKQLAAPPITEAERAADRAKIEEMIAELHERIPAQRLETYRSETPAAQARRDLLKQAAEKFTAGILDGSVPNPLEGRRA